ncbi:hypothetical protein DACRYDRAFT_116428 [Dacryopinax primogenitus]|uniref:NAD(+) diphosphatase n=1 Tax=Dacryopinax primogenitus (strain DJM 731) TaxID=1858805 RepID=M5G854_DACPD|nr:uncharacterized protein DACRYDRAFT_116428 [Dacryopinax primogenitus]EJU02047.1 hypothetical protein DACRYDRAFT_116428 [Dacryopinax primogenitus]
MADNYVHFHSSPPINRLSYLRHSTVFLNIALTHPRALFTLFHTGRPLLTGGKAAHVPFDRISPLVGQAPYFGQGEKEGESAEKGKWTEACRFRDRGVPLVFLGVLEDEGAALLPSEEVKQIASHEEIKGVPYWAVDLSDVDESWVQGVEELKDGKWSEPRSATSTYSHFDGAVFAVARSVVDWNARNGFCPACGGEGFSLWGGWKLGCSSNLPWAKNKNPYKGGPCPSGKGLHNFAHPRTDGVIIVAVVRESPTGEGEDILLGRQKSWPKGMYSTLAGFLEPGESVEDAVRREILEESGIVVGYVRYHSSQPWPYPANLMMGCYARAEVPTSAASDTQNPRAGIRLDLDNELEDARWFTRAEIRSILGDPDGTIIRQAPPANGAVSESTVRTEEGMKVRVPPRTAIAGVLISEWAAGNMANM